MQYLTKHCRTSGIFIVIAVSSISLLFCERQPEVSDELVAQVNDSYLLINQLNYLVPENIDPEFPKRVNKGDIINIELG